MILTNSTSKPHATLTRSVRVLPAPRHHDQPTDTRCGETNTARCVSSWNDNGLRRYAWDNKKMFRTSYFPGLGWMLRKELWDELGPKWPKVRVP